MAGEQINIGLVSHSIDGGKKWMNRPLGKMEYRSNSVNVDIMEVMKVESISKVYGYRTRLTPTMARDQYSRKK